MNLAGVARDTEGNPVKDASVSLHLNASEWIYREYQKKRSERKDESPEAFSDLLARVETDAQGRFRFSDVRCPVIEGSGGGFASIHHCRDRCESPIRMGNDDVSTQRRDERPESCDQNVSDRTSRGEVCVHRKVFPIVGASVDLAGANRSAIEELGELDGQIPFAPFSVRTTTTGDGTFSLRGIPSETIAVLNLRHESWADRYLGFMLGGNQRSDKTPSGLTPLFGPKLYRSGENVEADPGYLISGKIFGPDDEPVPGVMVSNHGSTDSEGRFRFRLSNHSRDRSLRRPDKSLKLFFYPKQSSPFLASHYAHPVDDPRAIESPLTIRLNRGYRVAGRAVDPLGQPLKGIQVRLVASGTRSTSETNPEGRYELLVPDGEHTIAFGTDRPGFAIPSTRRLMFLASDSTDDHLHHRISVDGNDLELRDTEIPRKRNGQCLGKVSRWEVCRKRDAGHRRQTAQTKSAAELSHLS